MSLSKFLLRFQPLFNEAGRDSPNVRLDSATSTAMPTRRGTAAQRGPSKMESLRKATILMLTPEKRIGDAPGGMAGLKSIILSSWLNLLLVFIPISVSSLAYFLHSKRVFERFHSLILVGIPFWASPIVCKPRHSHFRQ